MPYEIFVQLAISGLTTGAIYSLIALGFITIYRASNILNLAQGEFVMLGALRIFFLEKLGFSYFLAAVSSIILVAIVGLFLQRAVIHPLRDKPVLILIMVTIGLSIFMSGSAGILFGPSPQSLPPFVDAAPVEILGSVRINIQSFFVVGATLLLLLVLYLLSNHTYIGKAMEAVATDRLGSDLTGIPGKSYRDAFIWNQRRYWRCCRNIYHPALFYTIQLRSHIGFKRICRGSHRRMGKILRCCIGRFYPWCRRIRECGIYSCGI